MKRFIALVVCLLMVVGIAAQAEDLDLSGMTYDELVKLKERINLAIWNSQSWQEVTVPVGVWEVGKDIPVGHWTISVPGEGKYAHATVYYCDKLDASGRNPAGKYDCDIYYNCMIRGKNQDNDRYPLEIDIDCQEGTYFIIESGDVLFTPYTGKPDLGFN